MPLTPQRVLRDRILMVLAGRDSGSLSRAEVLTTLADDYAERWTVQDVQAPSSRPFETKWRNRASYERADMVRDGLLQDRADGMWALTGVGGSAAAAVVAADGDALSDEMLRREAMWQQILDSDDPQAVRAGQLNEMRLFRGGRGVYADAETTRGILGEDGVAVSFLHNGSSYADELSSGGVRYHYPKTARQGRDQAEISASKAAYRTALPIFVVTLGPTGQTRTVHRGYIEDYDDGLELFLVTFTDGEMPPPPPDDSPFSLTGDPATETCGKRRARPNQQRFAFHVLKRYGASCAVCGLAITQLLHAAHLRSKKDQGSDDARNGLPLCANHHLAFDSGLWSIESSTTQLVTKKAGPSLAELGISCSDLQHLPAQPHADALAHVWNAWKGSTD
jgi:putative restriction endonuclease